MLIKKKKSIKRNSKLSFIFFSEHPKIWNKVLNFFYAFRLPYSPLIFLYLFNPNRPIISTLFPGDKCSFLFLGYIRIFQTKSFCKNHKKFINYV